MASVTPHKSKHACPQNYGLLQDYINKGLAEFSPVVEVIRLFHTGDEIYKMELMTDFISFRDVTAHKRVSDMSYHQMTAAFIRFCRETVGLPDICLKTTRVLPSKFARMVDINFMICSTWYVNIRNHFKEKKLEVQQRTVNNLRKDLQSYAQRSSFREYSFPDNPRDIIYVSRGDATKQLNEEMLKEFAEVLSTSIDTERTYPTEEIKLLKTWYEEAESLAKTGTTHAAVQAVMKHHECPCDCNGDNGVSTSQMDALADKVVKNLIFN